MTCLWGTFNANLTGRLRKQIDDNAALTETLLAHTIPDAVGGIVTPILAVGLLFVFDWRMGLACLIPHDYRACLPDDHDDRDRHEVL